MPSARPSRAAPLNHQRALARGVARRALIEARRNGLGVEELVMTIREVAAEEEGEPSPSAPAASQGDDE